MSFVLFHSCGVVRIEPFSRAEWIHPLMCWTLERLKIDELVSMASFRSALRRYLNCTSSDPLFSTDTNLLAGHSVISTLIARLNTVSRRPKLSSCRLKWPLSAHDVVFIVNDVRLTLVTNIISFCVKNGRALVGRSCLIFTRGFEVLDLLSSTPVLVSTASMIFCIWIGVA